MTEKYINIEHLIHSFKTAIACIIGFLIANLIGYSNGLWVIITIIVVMCAQIYVGSVLWKSYLRFLGTFIGCLFAAITLVSVGPNPLGVLVTISISSFIFSYIATSNENLIYAGTLGAATTTIILLNPNPTLGLAGQRFLEISTGILIATVISQFFLPIHARTHLRRNQAHTLEQMRDFFKACMITRQADMEDSSYYEEVDETIAKTLSKQRQLAKDAGREPFGASFDPKVFMQSLLCEKEILRAIDFMRIALNNIENAETLFLHSSLFRTFNEEVIQCFNELIKAIQIDKPLSTHMHPPSLSIFKEELIKKLDVESKAESIYIDGFLFAAEVLTNCFIRLANLYNIPLRD